MSTDNPDEVMTIEEWIEAEGDLTAGFLVAFTREAMEVTLALHSAAAALGGGACAGFSEKLREEVESALRPWKAVARTGAAFLEALTDLREQMISEPDDDETEHDEHDDEHDEHDASVVSTIGQLEALPAAMLIRDAEDWVCMRMEDRWGTRGQTGGDDHEDVTLPARVLYVPEGADK